MASRTNPVLGPRALNRATLARQLLLRRSGMSARDAVAHLVGLQAQNVKPPYFQLHARLDGFRPEQLSGLMESRQVVRMVTMRSTIHTHTAEDAVALRALVQPARDREVAYFRKGLVGVDLDRLAVIARELVGERPRTMAEIRAALAVHWPEADPQALSVAARCRLPLVQVTPRGLWGRSGQVRLAPLEQWLGEATVATEGREEGAVGVVGAVEGVEGVEGVVLRYLNAFGPASVKDMQTWAGITRLKEVFERLRPRLVSFRDEAGTELFDLPGAPRPDEDTPAPPRFLPEFDNLLLSHADRTRVVPAGHKGRMWKGNQAYCTLLVDGFLAGLWRLDEEPAGDGRAELTVELFERAGRGRAEEIVAEGEALLAGMTGAGRTAVRFGTVAR
ncbi:winged helix DNA-binding domain-containing protein [Streptomyces sp. NPDC048603]|uniref:winged helix DNA-binding domain-containing protein n=1 Tax=Streptomyces sp. NPDC048603 TaxID=3365577 RepID=UPI003723F6FC